MGRERCYNIADLERQARRRLPRPMWDYLAGGADDELTLQRNVAAFDRYELLPQVLTDVARIDTRTRVLGAELEWPVILAPTGMSRLFHADGELAVARAAARSGTLYCLSTLASSSIEAVAAASAGPKCFQVYLLRDRGLTREYLQRCRAAGIGSLCLTVDVPVAGNRERDMRSGMTVPPRLTLRSLLQIARRPAWCWDLLTSPRLEFPNISQLSAVEGAATEGMVQRFSRQFVRDVTWKDVEWMAGEWGGPFAIKGVLTVADARRAAACGASAIFVSNHGGRQLDGVPATIDVIAEIAEALAGKLEIILDGGVRRGTHVLKALARGARACAIGRAYLYGLAAGGEAGVDRALALLRQEVERGLVLLGRNSVNQLGPGCVRVRPGN